MHETTETGQGNRPTHRVYFIKDPESKQAKWLEIGAAWQNEKGSISMTIDRMPYNGFPEGGECKFTLVRATQKSA